MNPEEEWRLYEVLYDWRVASQRQRWAYYDRKGLKAPDQSVFYDQLVCWHESVSYAQPAAFERMFEVW